MLPCHGTSSSVITSFGKLYAFALDLIIHSKEKLVLFGRVVCTLLLRSILLMTWMKTVEFVQSWVVPEAWLPV